MESEIFDLHLPNCWNSIQSALWQLQQGNSERAIACLEAAQRSLTKVKSAAPSKLFAMEREE